MYIQSVYFQLESTVFRKQGATDEIDGAINRTCVLVDGISKSITRSNYPVLGSERR